MNRKDGEYLDGHIFHRTSGPICGSNILDNNGVLIIIQYVTKTKLIIF